MGSKKKMTGNVKILDGPSKPSYFGHMLLRIMTNSGTIISCYWSMIIFFKSKEQQCKRTNLHSFFNAQLTKEKFVTEPKSSLDHCTFGNDNFSPYVVQLVGS